MTNRRSVLKLAATAGAGGILIPGSGAAATARSGPAANRDAKAVQARDGTELFVRDWGTGQAVLFLAGWTLPSDFWSYQMVGLAGRGFRAVAYDRRGHGRSSDPGRGYDFDTLADDLASVIERLALRDVTLVGHSMASGEIARYFARHGGERVARALFVAPTTPYLMQAPDNPDGIERSVLASLRAPLARDFPRWIAANAKPFFTPETSAELIDWGKQLMLRTSLHAVVECARALAETDFRADLARCDVPSLVIHGDRDLSAPLPLTGRRTAELLPNARLVVYEGAPHGLPLTHIERLDTDLLAFLRE